jgi:hypothetical protein
LKEQEMNALAKAPRTADIGCSREQLRTYLQECGYWANEEDEARYHYVLSPSAYILSPSQQTQLDRLGKTTHAAVRAINARLCDIAKEKSPSSHSDARLIGIANSASRSLLRPLHGVREVPPVIKVDLVEDPYGRFHIVEVDTYNPRGLGFCAFLEGSFNRFSTVPRYWGTWGTARRLDKARKFPGPWYVVVSEYERFYENAFVVFKNAMALADTEVVLVREQSLAHDRSLIPGEGANLLIIPESLNVYPAVRDDLLARYQEGRLNVFFPPVAYLGSKALLPYLRECDGMQEFIPPSALVGKKCGDPEALVDTTRPTVLKAAVSSGMKGVYFSDLDKNFPDALVRARALGKPTWILQEQVPQETTTIPVFTKSGDVEVRDYYLRITAYITEKGTLDAEVTGRPDRKVHGAPDCIMIPTVFG